jgi:Flp pilus assembly pilin Flp
MPGRARQQGVRVATMYRLKDRWYRAGTVLVGSRRLRVFRVPTSGRRQRRNEDGVTMLEYILLVALVAMLAFGSLVYLGRGNGSPASVVNNVGNVAEGGDPTASQYGESSSGASGDTAVKAWCTTGQTGCTDPMDMNGQTEVITFQVSGGTGGYAYQLTGNVPPFVTHDWAEQTVTIRPTNCEQDVGTYDISLVVTDNAGDTGQLNFTLNVAPGSLCPG